MIVPPDHFVPEEYYNTWRHALLRVPHHFPYEHIRKDRFTGEKAPFRVFDIQNRMIFGIAHEPHYTLIYRSTVSRDFYRVHIYASELY